MCFIVEGAGQFPFDMLRWDECVPVMEEDSHAMAREGEFRQIKMKLVGCKKKPTYDRWASFGWRITGKMHSHIETVLQN
jgi:hypothetical protein